MLKECKDTSRPWQYLVSNDRFRRKKLWSWASEVGRCEIENWLISNSNAYTKLSEMKTHLILYIMVVRK